MNRDSGLIRPKALSQKVLGIAAGVLRRAQARPLYRTLGKRFVPHVRIVEANADDLEAHERHFFPPEPYHAPPPDVNLKNYVAKHGAKVIGLVRLKRCPEAQSPWAGTWLCSLEVWTQYRGCGIGEMLTQRVVAQAAADGDSELFLAVFEDNSRAIALYRKLGFEQVTLPALEPELTAEKHRFGRRRIVMRKRLAVHR